MKIANLNGRATLVIGPAGHEQILDVAAASAGAYGPEPMNLFKDWNAFRDWVATLDPCPVSDAPGEEIAVGHQWGPPVPAPRQVFGFGLNYDERASEGGLAGAPTPVVFTKFPSCLVGAYAEVTLPTATVDWEVELVVAIATEAHRVPPHQAWEHVAGLMIGQDLSERTQQFLPPVPQFSLAKSYPGFGPTGPWLVTPDELTNVGSLALECSLNGHVQQAGTVSQMRVPIAELISRLSDQVVLLPGDLIFTGTPGGVGHHQDPPRYLHAGDSLVSTITGLGRQEVHFK